MVGKEESGADARVAGVRKRVMRGVRLYYIEALPNLSLNVIRYAARYAR